VLQHINLGVALATVAPLLPSLPANAATEVSRDDGLQLPSRNVRRRRLLPSPLSLIICCFLLLGVWYSVATPILEVSDEDTQEAVIWQIGTGHGLPVMQPADPRHLLVPAQEAGQPPLSYLLAAAATFWIHPPAPVDSMVFNPQANIGSPDYNVRNRNLFAHSAAEDFPWHGLALAVHIQRLLSLLYGACAIAGVYRLGYLAAPRYAAVATLAAAICAFNPMVLFIAASADNDMLAVALCTSTLAMLATTLHLGLTWRRTLLTAILLGLTLLSKLNAAAVGIPVLGVYLYLGITYRPTKDWLRHLAVLGGIAGLIGGWWYLRNCLLYHDPLALSTFVGITGPRPQALSLAQVLREAPSVWYSFWGIFGNFSILLPSGYYQGYRLFAMLAASGLLMAGLNRLRATRRCNPVLVLLLAWLGIEVILLVHWTAVTSGSTGRLLFPALGSIAVLLAMGITAVVGLVPWRVPAMPVLAAVGAAGAALAVPLAILPAYPQPQYVGLTQVQPERTLDYRFGNLDLIGSTMPAGPLAPGQTVPVTLYWHAIGPIPANDAEALVLRGPDGTVLTAVDTLPGNAEVLTSQMSSQQVLVDTIPLQIPSTSPTPILSLLSVDVYPIGQPGRPIKASDAHGQSIGAPLLARLELRQPDRAASPIPVPLGIFGGTMALVGASAPTAAPAGGSLAVQLHWQAIGDTAVDAHEVVQLVNRQGTTVAQMARRPHSGGLPTGDWITGEQVTDTLPLPIAPDVVPGAYTLRLELRDAAGQLIPADIGQSGITIAQINVEPAVPVVPPGVTINESFGNLQLAGVTVPSDPVAPGTPVTVTLVWRATGPISDDAVVSVQLRGPDGFLVAQHDGRPLNGALLTTEWPLGWGVTDRVTLTTNSASPAPSLAHLVVQVYPAGHPDEQVVARSSGGAAVGTAQVASIILRSTGPPAAITPLPQAVHAILGNQVELVGAALPQAAAAGSPVSVRLRWQALQALRGDYTAFIHGTDARGRLVFQADSRPHGGRLPTTDWVAGEIVNDTMVVPIGDQTPSGSYALSVGLYDLHTMGRLLLANGQSEISLGSLQVTGSE